MDKKTEIKQFLKDIEQKYSIHIILAIESGSRAWGFPSQDSDFDIRLIYHHPENWYLSAFKKRNVIENIFDGDLDAAGWDITKCLQLLYKSNAPLYEWLHSPIVYQQDEEKLKPLKELAFKAFNPKLAFYHYISLAKKKLPDEKTQYNSKSFLYALRALLCARWIEDKKSIPPVKFSILVDTYILDNTIKIQLSELLANKLLLSESDGGQLSNELFSYANDLYLELEKSDVIANNFKTITEYDKVLLNIIKKNT